MICRLFLAPEDLLRHAVDPMTPPVPPDVLAHWRDLAGRPLAPFGNGLINSTFLVEGARGKAVLQRLHPIFAGAVNEDIEAVTSHLAGKGLVTPRIVRTDDGALWAHDSDGRPWRVLTYIDGTSVDSVDSPERARSAAALLAKFHRAVSDLDWTYRHVRAGVHDTARHLATLEQAVVSHMGHPLHARVAPVAARLLARAQKLPDFDALPSRHVHGDPKISNVLFDDAGRALCLVDLDTVGRMPWPHELGDALRSWCNPAGEDVADNALDVSVFRAAVEGYASEAAGLVTPAEVDRLVDGLSCICLELAARFLADALEESYFGWNAERYTSRGEHNLVRALGQWSLHESVESKRAELETIVREAFKA